MEVARAPKKLIPPGSRILVAPQCEAITVYFQSHQASLDASGFSQTTADMPAGQHPLRSADGRGDARVGSKTVRSGTLIAVLALVLGPFVARASWLRFQLTSPVTYFPAHWVRPSTEAGGAAPACATLLSGLEGENNQIRFCEDAEMLHGPGLDGWALLSCDPGRDQWNTVMG